METTDTTKMTAEEQLVLSQTRWTMISENVAKVKADPAFKPDPSKWIFILPALNSDMLHFFNLPMIEGKTFEETFALTQNTYTNFLLDKGQEKTHAFVGNVYEGLDERKLNANAAQHAEFMWLLIHHLNGMSLSSPVGFTEIYTKEQVLFFAMSPTRKRESEPAKAASKM